MQHVGEPPAAYAPPQPNKRGLLIGLTLGIAVLLGLVAGLSVAVFKPAPTPAPHSSALPEPAAQPQSVPTQPAALPEPAVTEPIPALTAPPKASASAPISAPDSANALQQLQDARAAAQAATETATETTAQQASVAQAPAEQSATNKPPIAANPEIITWLSQAKITGVRLSDTGNKVILNNKAYAAGETAHFGLKLKVLLIQQHRVFFIDANGKKYMKRL